MPKDRKSWNKTAPKNIGHTEWIAHFSLKLDLLYDVIVWLLHGAKERVWKAFHVSVAQLRHKVNQVKQKHELRSEGVK